MLLLYFITLFLRLNILCNSQQYNLEYQNFSMIHNINGNCHLIDISILSNVELQPSSIYISTIKPSEYEVKSYLELPSTLTKSNPNLSEGLVGGKSVIDNWVNNKENNWQLEPNHPRNNKENCMKITKLTKETAVEIYDKYKLNKEYYLLKMVNVLIHETGIIGLSCGYYQPIEGCETIFKYIGKKWWNRCNSKFLYNKQSWPKYWYPNENIIEKFNHTECINGNSFKTPLKLYKKVFVISALWDNNYHHFMIDSLNRLIRHIDFLKSNTDIMIQIRGNENVFKKQFKRDNAIQMRNRLIELLGLDPNRFITGTILAEEVFVPKSVKCNDPLQSSYEIRLLVKYLKAQTIIKFNQLTTEETKLVNRFRVQRGKYNSQELVHNWNDKNRITLLVRQFKEGETKLDDWRAWNENQKSNYSRIIKKSFRLYQFTLISSADSMLTNCLHCQIKLFEKTNILIGVHGAGLTNMIFMPPGSLVVEIVGKFDGRMLPLCGYHGSLAAIFGIHHYIYYYDSKGGEVLDFNDLVKEVTNYHRFLSK